MTHLCRRACVGRVVRGKVDHSDVSACTRVAVCWSLQQGETDTRVMSR